MLLIISIALVSIVFFAWLLKHLVSFYKGLLKEVRSEVKETILYKFMKISVLSGILLFSIQIVLIVVLTTKFIMESV